jgi:hypothetical protein
MSQNFGIAMPGARSAAVHRQPVRYLVLIDSGCGMLARLFLASYELVNEFDAAATEVANSTAGLTPAIGALGAQWDRALTGHSRQERAAAEVYTLAT